MVLGFLLLPKLAVSLTLGMIQKLVPHEVPVFVGEDLDGGVSVECIQEADSCVGIYPLASKLIAAIYAVGVGRHFAIGLFENLHELLMRDLLHDDDLVGFPNGRQLVVEGLPFTGMGSIIVEAEFGRDRFGAC